MNTQTADRHDAQPSWLRSVLADADLPAPSSARRLHGRNENYLVQAGESAYLVKRIVGADRTARFARSQAHGQHPTSAAIAPALVYADDARHALIFSQVDGSESGSLLLVEERFTPQLCSHVGRAIAGVHTMDLDLTALPARGPILPTDKALRAFPIDAVHALTAGEVAAWRIIQSDLDLVDHLQTLRRASEGATTVPIHGDFRIDQVLVADGRPHLVDWEEYGPGDPAYDTGNWVGEWIYRAVLDIPTARGDGVSAEPEEVLSQRELDANDIIRRGINKLDALSPQIEAFWNGYQRVRPIDDAEAARVAGFAGWHLLDRLLALANSKAALPAVARAAAGVGKRLLANPTAAAQTLGLSPLAAHPQEAA